MACLIDIASKAEEDAYRAFVGWLQEAQKVRRMFLEADLSLPRALGLLFQDTKRKSRRKRVTE